ncbi:hypothetical protein SS50377_24936 [Spironucleus salmonicida]|uniref:Uncharacterized protein n=1 Tax=Spironucleus salmonicida TaxID=348837 RepID=A0A9P8RXF9_9EUKA|nr:hypothetical protein SS50377_24936 [Spironucleus salmonicida]
MNLNSLTKQINVLKANNIPQQQDELILAYRQLYTELLQIKDYQQAYGILEELIQLDASTADQMVLLKQLLGEGAE